MSYDARRYLPTKINLIRLRRERASFRRIRNILVEKRNALLLFIRAFLEEYEKLSRQSYERLREAERMYRELAVEMGHDKYLEFTRSFSQTLKVKVKSTIVFTIHAPIFTVDETSYPAIPKYGGTPIMAYNAVNMWREAFREYIKVIELEQMIRRLVEELKDTQRLINALDNVVLPSLDKTINFIKMILDERSREEFVRIKFVKRKLEKAKETVT